MVGLRAGAMGGVEQQELLRRCMIKSNAVNTMSSNNSEVQLQMCTAQSSYSLTRLRSASLPALEGVEGAGSGAG